MRLWLLRRLFWLFEWSYPTEFLKLDKGAMEKWFFDSYRTKGADEYYRMRSLTLLKTMGMGLPDRDYWINVGRRLELMTMYDEMRKAVELKKSKDEKERSKNVKKANEAEKESPEV